ncbi:MAG TPA: ABC transporter permease [Gemmataceae bacterium]|nr:ABC transporter permease [Gemmataceae bacterium]
MFALQLNDPITLVALGLVGLVGAGVSLFLLVGLFGARSLVRRELAAYFLSPVAYVVLVVFLAVLGCRFYLTLDQLTASGPRGTEFPMQFLFNLLSAEGESITFSRARLPELLSGVAFWLVYLLIPPLLTMRLFAEERSSGTLEPLMTAPLRDWQVVLSKYVACFGFYLFLWLPTLAYLPVLLGLGAPTWNAVWTPYSILFIGGLLAVAVALLSGLPRLGTRFRLAGLLLFFGGAACAVAGGWLHYHSDEGHVVEMTSAIDPWPVACTYLGLILVGAMLLAIGLLVSSLVRSQLVAALVSVAVSLALLIAGVWRYSLEGGSTWAQVLYSFGVPLHISQDFGRGLIDSRHLVLYVSVALFCLFLTVRSLESRRWR